MLKCPKHFEFHDDESMVDAVDCFDDPKPNLVADFAIPSDYGIDLIRKDGLLVYSFVLPMDECNHTIAEEINRMIRKAIRSAVNESSKSVASIKGKKRAK